MLIEEMLGAVRELVCIGIMSQTVLILDTMHSICLRLYYSKLLESVKRPSSFSLEKFGKDSRMINLKMFRKVESLVLDHLTHFGSLCSELRCVTYLAV